MSETLLAKLLGLSWDALKWTFGLVVALLTFLWKRQDGKIKRLSEDMATLKQTVVYRNDLDEKADQIRAEVKNEHQRIIDVLEKAMEDHQRKLITCNENVMGHISILRDDFKEAKENIKEVRNYMINHLERRQDKRD